MASPREEIERDNYCKGTVSKSPENFAYGSGSMKREQIPPPEIGLAHWLREQKDSKHWGTVKREYRHL